MMVPCSTLPWRRSRLALQHLRDGLSGECANEAASCEERQQPSRPDGLWDAPKRPSPFLSEFAEGKGRIESHLTERLPDRSLSGHAIHALRLEISHDPGRAVASRGARVRPVDREAAVVKESAPSESLKRCFDGEEWVTPFEEPDPEPEAGMAPMRECADRRAMRRLDRCELTQTLERARCDFLSDVQV